MTLFDNTQIVSDEAQHVTKFIHTVEGPRAAVAETVLYRYPDYETRTVVCCSTMSGCPVGCRFCGAGDNFVRNLTWEEIVEQVAHARIHTKVLPQDMGRFQIMFMSMGEPFLNMKNLIKAIRELHRLYPKAELLVSTIAPKISPDLWVEFLKVSEEIGKVGLQFSIHEASNTARNKLIPFKAKFTLSEVACLGRLWSRKTGRKAFVNYCAHEENSSLVDAVQLTKLFHPADFNYTVSVVCESNNGLPVNTEKQRSLATYFSSKLVYLGCDVRVFDPAGQDTIGGGCGQLWFVQEWMKNHPERCKPSHGAGLPRVQAPK